MGHQVFCLFDSEVNTVLLHLLVVILDVIQRQKHFLRYLGLSKF